MANDCVMLEGSRAGGGEEEGVENGGIELSLELSIGGGYAKSVKDGVDLEENGRRSSSGGSGEFGALVDPQAKPETQALRKKREGKLKRMHGNGNGCVKYDEDESRVRVRARDNGNGLIEPSSKREKIRDGTTGDNQGSLPVVPVQFMNGWMSVVGGNEVKDEKCGFQPMGCRSSRLYQGNRIMEQNCGKEGRPASRSVSPGQSPSYYQNINMLLGGNASDNGSNSSHRQRKIQQQKTIPSPSDPPQQSEPSNSSKQTESNQAAHTENNPDPTLRPHMPFVSTTGNGPNGRTVTGFLYRYNKEEVSIVCVCHGNSFSPVEFVGHAGGIDVTHPLSHISVIPSASFGV